MKHLNDNHSDLDLKCDFPAREAFRDELLARLLDADERTARQAAVTGDPEVRELADSELELLAAAQGEIHQQKTLF